MSERTRVCIHCSLRKQKCRLKSTTTNGWRHFGQSEQRKSFVLFPIQSGKSPDSGFFTYDPTNKCMMPSSRERYKGIIGRGHDLRLGGSGIVGPFLVPRFFRSTNADPFLHNRINRRTCHDTYDTWYCIATATWIFLISALWSWWTQQKKFIFLFLNINTVLSDSRKFRQHSHIKWNWIRSMTSEKVRIHFLSHVFVCCHPEILLPWHGDVAKSPLCLTG